MTSESKLLTMTKEVFGRREAEQIVRAVKNSLCEMKWHLRHRNKRRLLVDIMALSTRLRSVILIDYGGKMPILQQQLHLLLISAQQECPLLNSLKVMVIEEMVYLAHVDAMLEDMLLCLGMQVPLLFVVLDQGPVKLVSLEDEDVTAELFVSIQKSFSSTIMNANTQLKETLNLVNTEFLPKKASESTSQASEILDLGQPVKLYQIALPTLNGWLLGYPIVYLFDRENVNQAVTKLCAMQLYLFQILVCSKDNLFEELDSEEELLSFSVPIDLCPLGKEEAWAARFYNWMVEKWSPYQHIWSCIKFEVTKCPMTSIVL